jgi:hypothetical protein
MNLRDKIEKENKEKEDAYTDLKGRRKFKCHCGKLHAFKSCVAIQTRWYVTPSGCNGGDCWDDGEFQILCPVTDIRNRLFFTKHEDYEKRVRYIHNLEDQFKREYINCFKEVIQIYEEEDYSHFYNNWYIDENFRRFDLKKGE